MKNPVCKELLLYQPTIAEDENLRSWYIVNSVLNAFLSISAIILNSVTILALRKTPSLPKPLKTLLLSLAVFDLGVGLVVEPFFFGLLVKWLQRNGSSWAVCTAFETIETFFSAASFFGVMALSSDRFLAVHLHLRYQEFVTHGRVVAVVISIWVISAFLSLLFLWVSPLICFIVFAVIGVVCLILSVILYFKIYFTVRRHRNEIQALQVQQTNAARPRKSAVGTFYVYIVFMLCCLPQFCSFTVIVMSDLTTGVYVFHISSLTLFFLNSSLSPIIYCWKMRQIRRTVIDIARNTFQQLRKASVTNRQRSSAR